MIMSELESRTRGLNIARGILIGIVFAFGVWLLLAALVAAVVTLWP